MAVTVDRRDLILCRLFEILGEYNVTLAGGLNGPVTISGDHVVRNRDELPEELVPGLIMLDADEVKDKRELVPPGRQGPTKGAVAVPCLMRMTPEVYIVLDVRKPANLNVGKDLDTARAALINLVLHDQGLAAICGSNGQILYDGCITDLARNRTMRGQMGLSFTFIYPFIPDEFSGFSYNGE